MIDYTLGDWRDHQPVPSSVDLVICDPVYQATPDYLTSVTHALRPGGSWYVFGRYVGIAETKLALDADKTLQFQNWIIWGPNDWGARSLRRWGQKHDDILFYTKKGADHYFNGDAVAVPKKMKQAVFNPSGRTTKIPNSVWYDLAGFSTISNERVRVNGKCVRWQKPVSVIKRIMWASSKPGDLVYDPFSGVATVPAVCHMLNRNCIASEIDLDVWCAGKKRLQKSGVTL